MPLSLTQVADWSCSKEAQNPLSETVAPPIGTAIEPSMFQPISSLKPSENLKVWVTGRGELFGPFVIIDVTSGNVSEAMPPPTEMVAVPTCIDPSPAGKSCAPAGAASARKVASVTAADAGACLAQSERPTKRQCASKLERAMTANSTRTRQYD